METVRTVLILSGLRFTSLFDMSQKKFTRFLTCREKRIGAFRPEKKLRMKSRYPESFRFLCLCIWGTLGNKKSQVLFKGRRLHYPLPSSLSKAAPGLWLFINVPFTRAIDSCWKRCLMATVSFSLVCWARKLPSYTTPQFKISPRQI